jgi:hypothetical protein
MIGEDLGMGGNTGMIASNKIFATESFAMVARVQAAFFSFSVLWMLNDHHNMVIQFLLMLPTIS